MKRYFITVDWCERGERGIFCARDGTAFGKDTQHTQEEMDEYLGAFTLILAPKSELFSEKEVHAYNRFVPLAEYRGRFGISLPRKTL